MFFHFIIFSLLPQSSAECENACYGHGYCSQYDMCICHRNWQANDCSERTCPFGLAFADTPKGDLDSSGSVEDADKIIAINSFTYPYGTTKAFPEMRDSDLTVLDESAHYYMECSNTGYCDRTTGECKCFEGFTGTACARMRCPSGFDGKECTGHGVCRSLRQIAAADYNSVYELWSGDIVRGCVCDKGWHGGDCSLRQCKFDVDPMYLDDVANLRYSKYFFALLTTSLYADFDDGIPQPGPGAWAIRFYDIYGQEWVTKPIAATASCEEIIAALEELPNKVIPRGGTYCARADVIQRDPLEGDGGFKTKFLSRYTAYFSGPRTQYIQNKPAFWVAGYHNSYAKNVTSDRNVSGEIYRIEFLNNPGMLKQPEIEIYLGDGSRPSLYSEKGTLITKTWTNGQQGESSDYVSNHCFGVTTRIAVKDGYHYLSSFGPGEKYRLKACLGESDYNPSNTPISEPFAWDYGSVYYPHLVRLVRTVTDYTDGGFYAIIYYDTATTGIETNGIGADGNGADGTFKILHPFEQLEGLDFPVDYEVYTTKGTLHLIGNYSEASFDFASKHVFVSNITYDVDGLAYDGDIFCENSGSTTASYDCLDKGDLFFLLDPQTTEYNPPLLNMYTAKSLYKTWMDYPNYLMYPNVSKFESRRAESSHLHKNVIETDIATNWAQEAFEAANFRVFKFTPHLNSTYNYVTECSNRGVCDPFEGVCDCFAGYTGDGCNVQDALSI